MKQLTTYNRVAQYLNRIFDLMNTQLFDGELERPTISIQSSPKTYGHFTLRPDTWISKTGATHELNISAGTLARPVEMVCATMCHELCHYYAYIHQIKDVSRNYTYHNKRFKAIAEEHGLTVTHSEKYGWSHTEPGDLILDFVLTNELTDILLFRNEFYGISIGGTGGHSSSGNVTVPPVRKPSSSRKYQCPCCGNSVRATKNLNIACLDCQQKMDLV